MGKHNKTQLNIPMCMACILFCLTLITFHMCGGLYARYVSSDSGGDAARVASFHITESHTAFSDNLLVETAPGTVNTEILVKNHSEVAVAYTIAIQNKTQNIPYQFQINGSEAKLYECSATCYLEPNSQKTITISAIWEQEGALKYMGMVDLVTITINAQQVD